MKEDKTYHEKFRDELLSNPKLKEKYLIAREKIKLEMMLETLKYQIIEDKSRKAILSQITKISNRVSRIYL